MWGSDFFQVVHGEVTAIGELVVTGDYPKGTMMENFDTLSAIPSNGAAVGFLMKDVSTTGPTFERMTLGYPDLPALSGDAVSIGIVDIGGEIEIENEPSKTATGTGAGIMVTSGTGAITAATVKNLAVSTKNGRFYLAQTGDIVWGLIIDAALTPITAGNIRVRIKKIAGYVK